MYENQLQELHSMGTEIAKLKSENKRTKTSIARMKSYHARKQIRVLKEHDNGAYNF